jgi:all-trans-8'-apo-beta-carotenal 15,15'-oxygenase
MSANAPTEPAWRLGFQSLETECREPVALRVRGTIPHAVHGTLYRIGPARHVVYGSPLRHWFDGDGMMHSFAISESGIEYRNRFVLSHGRLAEDRARRRLFRSFGTPVPGGPIERFRRRKGGKNASNTNMVFHAGELWALGEGGWPHRIDPITLATLGETDLGGGLQEGEGYSAHPHFCETTSELWNFSVLFGRKRTMSIHCRDSQGRDRIVARFPMPLPAMVHDFALTATHVLVKFDPYVLPAFPLWLLLGQRSPGQLFTWRPELGTRIAIIPRAGGEPRWVQLEPRLAVHSISAYNDGPDLVWDVVSFADDTIMKVFAQVMVGPIKTPAWCFPERIRIPPTGRVTVERIAETPLDLPRHLAPVGKPHRHVFGVTWTDRRDFLSAPACLDVASGHTAIAPLLAGEYAGECIPVRKHGATSDRAAWLLTVVLDTTARRSELRIYDGEDLAAPPVASAPLPHVMPFGFHGCFVRA